jgi:amino acid transporter
VTSIAVIGLYVAYLIPVFLRRINDDAFHPGPWKLNKWGPVIGWIAIVWVVFICIILMLPQTGGKFSWTTFNYAPVAVAVAAVLGFAGMWYAVSARKWFKGPKIQGSAEELAAIERELSI